MSEQTGWMRSLSLVVIVFAISVDSGAKLGLAQVRQPQPTASVDLSGKWKLETGETVLITQESSGEVTAQFSPEAPCWNRSITKLFIAPLSFNVDGILPYHRLEGDQFWACTRTKKMMDDCGLPDIFKTNFWATVSADGITISGENFRDGWTFEDSGGRWVNCHRSSKFDRWLEFSLTRACLWRGTWEAVAEVTPGTVGDVNSLLRDRVEVPFSFWVGKDGTLKGSGTATLTLEGLIEPTPGQSHSSIFREQVPESFPVMITGRQSGSDTATIFLSAPGVTAKRTVYIPKTDIDERISKTYPFSPWGLTERSFREGFTIRLEDRWSGDRAPIRMSTEHGVLDLTTKVTVSQPAC